MAHSLSAKKRARQNVKKRTINRARKSMVKTELKNFNETLSASNAEQAEVQFQKLSAQLDKTASTSTMHKNTAARVKSRQAKRVNALKTKNA